ncbi:MAG TPA: hypothetical protein VGE12_14665 [Noviherbaspirillum sp.]
MQYLLVSMLVGALFGGGMAIAQSAAEPPKESRKPSYLAKFDELFKTADKDGDGGLTRAEAESARMGRVVDNFDRLDADKDGKVTRTEIRALVRGRLTL